MIRGRKLKRKRSHTNNLFFQRISMFSQMIQRNLLPFAHRSVALNLTYALPSRGRKLKRKRSHTKEDIHFYMIYNHPAFFVRRKVFDEIGMFQTQYKIAADYESISKK